MKPSKNTTSLEQSMIKRRPCDILQQPEYDELKYQIRKWDDYTKHLKGVIRGLDKDGLFKHLYEE